MTNKIFDVHVHAGNFNLLREDIRGLLTKYEYEPDAAVEEIFSTPAYLKNYLERNGVYRAVVLAECGPGTNFSIDSTLILKFCQEHDIFIPFGSINPNFHEDPESEFNRNLLDGIKGYKFYPADHDFNPFTKEMMNVYGGCQEAEIPIMFHTGLTAQKNTEQKYIKPGDFIKLARTFPELTIILAHGGKPTWYNEALEMADTFENVYLDTALVPPSDVLEWLSFSKSVEDKILFGSDLPVCGAYSSLCDKYYSSLLDERIKNKIMRANAESLLGDLVAAPALEED